MRICHSTIRALVTPGTARPGADSALQFMPKVFRGDKVRFFHSKHGKSYLYWTNFVLIGNDWTCLGLLGLLKENLNDTVYEDMLDSFVHLSIWQQFEEHTVKLWSGIHILLTKCVWKLLSCKSDYRLPFTFKPCFFPMSETLDPSHELISFLCAVKNIQNSQKPPSYLNNWSVQIIHWSQRSLLHDPSFRTHLTQDAEAASVNSTICKKVSKGFCNKPIKKQHRDSSWCCQPGNHYLSKMTYGC